MDVPPRRPYVGIGVSTACLDVAILPSGESFVVANDEEGLDQLPGRLEDFPSLVLEASGGFERLVGAALAAVGIAVAVLSPRQTRDFARATGKLAKTGALDARALARFTEAACPAYGMLPYAEAREFRGILARRRWLIQVVTAEKNRSGATTSRAIGGRIEVHIRWLEKELSRTDQDLDKATEGGPAFEENEALLRSVSGVGPVLCRTISAELPELGSLSPGELSALVDVAPHNRDSGTSRGRRSARCGGGRAREAFYMGALIASRYNPTI